MLLLQEQNRQKPGGKPRELGAGLTMKGREERHIHGPKVLLGFAKPWVLLSGQSERLQSHRLWDNSDTAKEARTSRMRVSVSCGHAARDTLEHVLWGLFWGMEIPCSEGSQHPRWGEWVWQSFHAPW